LCGDFDFETTGPTQIEAEELQMSHGEYTREDSRADRAAAFTGLAAGIAWILVVAAISYFIAIRRG
jgi:hypothetical protein